LLSIIPSGLIIAGDKSIDPEYGYDIDGISGWKVCFIGCIFLEDDKTRLDEKIPCCLVLGKKENDIIHFSLNTWCRISRTKVKNHYKLKLTSKSKYINFFSNKNNSKPEFQDCLLQLSKNRGGISDFYGDSVMTAEKQMEMFDEFEKVCKTNYENEEYTFDKKSR
jgi:hypothetical protein